MEETQQRLVKQIDIFGVTKVPRHTLGNYWIHSKVDRKPVFFGTHQSTGVEHVIKRADIGRPLTEEEKKTLRLTDEQLANKLLEYEHQIQAKLSHPNILAATEFFGQNGKWHIATPYSGITLDDFFFNQPARELDPVAEKQENLRILYQIAQALAYCHANDVAHLDVKPTNITVDDTAKATLIDFGSARKLKGKKEPIIESVPLITTSHAALEQIQYEYSAKSDTFAYAVLAYELLTGKDAFERINDKAINHDNPKHDIRLISQFENLAYLLVRAMSNNPEQRPPMQQMADALERLV